MGLFLKLMSLATLLHMATCLREFSYCEMYDNIVKTFTGGMRAVAPISMALDPREKTLGRFIHVQGKAYFIGFDPLTFIGAIQFCEIRRMRLIALEEIDEGQLFSNTDIRSHFNASGTVAWTSADADAACIDTCSSVIWCSTSDKKNSSLLYSLVLSNVDNCIVFDTFLKRLKSFDCKQTATAICEPSCRAACPSSELCEKNEMLFRNLLEESYATANHGQWVTSGDYNEDSYLFGNQMTNWTENWNKCCELGLKPLTGVWKNAFLGMDVGNAFWTSEVTAVCGSHVTNQCFTEDQSLDITGDKIERETFGDGQCVALLKLDRVVLTHLPCEKQLKFACQGPRFKSFVNDTAPKKRPCATPKCGMSLDRCDLHPESWNAIEPCVHGTWFQNCGIVLLLPRQKETWSGAKKFCCSLGMSVLTVQNREKQKCLSGLREKNELKGKQFWTAGRDLKKCPGKFRWCSPKLNDFVAKDLQWASAKMADKRDACIYVNAQDPKLATDDCQAKKRFLCEGWSNYTGNMIGAMNECLHLAGVSQAEVLSVQVDPLHRVGKGIKISFRCILEQAGIIFDESSRVNRAAFNDILAASVTKLKPWTESVEVLNKLHRQAEQTATEIGYKYGTRKKIFFRASSQLWLQTQYGTRKKNLISTLQSEFKSCSTKAIPGDGLAFNLYKCMVARSPVLKNFWSFFEIRSIQDRTHIGPIDSLNSIGGKCYKILKWQECPDKFLIRKQEIMSFTDIMENRFDWHLKQCIRYGGSLPYATTKAEFEYWTAFFHKNYMYVQWDYAFGSRDNLTWCAANSPLGPHRVPVPVIGHLEAPFALISVKSGRNITMRATPFTSRIYHSPVVCRIQDMQVLQECRSRSSISYVNESGGIINSTKYSPGLELFIDD